MNKTPTYNGLTIYKKKINRHYSIQINYLVDVGTYRIEMLNTTENTNWVVASNYWIKTKRQFLFLLNNCFDTNVIGWSNLK